MPTQTERFDSFIIKDIGKFKKRAVTRFDEYVDIATWTYWNAL